MKTSQTMMMIMTWRGLPRLSQQMERTRQRHCVPKHTHFDDMESFLYVVFLFFFSYAGPLSKEELRDADTRGFVQPTGSGQFAHTRRWPHELEMWSKGGMRQLAKDKDVNLATQAGVSDLLNNPEIQNCLKQNWASGLQKGIKRLLFALWGLFARSRLRPTAHLPRTEVEHQEFIDVLDKWLKKYHGKEQEFSNCPFT
ncbi:hypothetical protein BDN67DRAFT_816041 [Paxillus ammoniavirescens]|nr:hypothetical protein BDN67DRAFT_816041 [Paxillus ammoniavirescens]